MLTPLRLGAGPSAPLFATGAVEAIHLRCLATALLLALGIDGLSHDAPNLGHELG